MRVITTNNRFWFSTDFELNCRNRQVALCTVPFPRSCPPTSLPVQDSAAEQTQRRDEPSISETGFYVAVKGKSADQRAVAVFVCLILSR